MGRSVSSNHRSSTWELCGLGKVTYTLRAQFPDDYSLRGLLLGDRMLHMGLGT